MQATDGQPHIFSYELAQRSAGYKKTRCNVGANHFLDGFGVIEAYRWGLGSASEQSRIAKMVTGLACVLKAEAY
jgi:hypothetical protein